MRSGRCLALALTAALLAGCAADVPANQSAVASDASMQSEKIRSPQVQVDWSVLAEQSSDFQSDTDGGRWYADYTDRLIAGEDYGQLIPYVGAFAYQVERWADQNGQEQVYYAPWPTSLYGLMTREGRIVVDPVYQGVHSVEFSWQGETTCLPVLMLSQSSDESKDFVNGRRYAVAAQDGSWCTEFEFWFYAAREDELLLAGPAGLTWMDAVSGNRVDWSWSFLEVSEEELTSVVEDMMWLYGFQWTGDGVFLGVMGKENWETAQVRLFSPETEAVSYCSTQEWEEMYDQWWKLRQETAETLTHQREGSQLTVTRGEETYILTLPDGVEHLGVQTEGDLCVVTDYTGDISRAWLYRLSDGERLWEQSSILFLYDRGGEEERVYLQTEEEGAICLYSLDLEPVLSVPAGSKTGSNYCSVHNGLLTVRDDVTFFGCYDLESGRCIFYRTLWLGD